jgi:hypothetical protein
MARCLIKDTFRMECVSCNQFRAVQSDWLMNYVRTGHELARTHAHTHTRVMDVCALRKSDWATPCQCVPYLRHVQAFAGTALARTMHLSPLLGLPKEANIRTESPKR